MRRRARWISALLAAAALGAVATPPAGATVTQVDGTILPVTAALQLFLNAEEGGPTINATLDAAQLPQIYRPSLGVVTFKDIGEGAGYENSFGYYNVGDDVRVTTNLHPILGCGVSAATHTTEAVGYVVNAEPGTTTTVNFATELAEGRYDGGFIAFYLITPEGNPSSVNCGDFKNDSFGISLFGRIYFTERDLNDDGDFVHHLVYTSRTMADRFYFGFEDLFRGGDNDFEDMLVSVRGLTPPCVPTPELCDAVDNDCDGLVDAADPSLVAVGVPCVCNGAGGLVCQGGNRSGICLTGTTACAAGGVVECRSTVLPTFEGCDALDNNCNGAVDDATLDSGAACDGSDGDLCAEGVTRCSAGALTCGDATGTSSEVCNGLDDDCDGVVDDAVEGLGVPCDGADGDNCVEGATTCFGGAVVCTDATGSTSEVCNGIDDDCDGVPDDEATDVGGACAVGVGACARNGAVRCFGGAPACNVTPGLPFEELCNSRDDDCDGAVDDGYGLGAACTGVGGCGGGGGVIECASLSSTRCSTGPGGSMSGVLPESCNGIDDDCDGTIDEGLADLGPCGTSVGECDSGRLRCLAGVPACSGATGATPEICDGLDNDCDGFLDELSGDPGDLDGGLIDEGATCGIDTGACEFGLTECAGGTLSCVGAVGPSGETCNGLDDDCDGIADDLPIDTGALCGPTDMGACEFGATICSAGALICVGTLGPTVEFCNSADDDCDGVVDDNPLGERGPCGDGTGRCTPGLSVCRAGAMSCEGATGPVPEECNGEDDDCDGFIDDAVAGEGFPCGLAILPCAPGTTACIGGALQCVGGVEPTTEICNALDDDCDGNLDEGELCSGVPCINGECSAPCVDDEFACPPGQACIDGHCFIDPCFAIDCPPGPGGELEVCRDGVCMLVCDGVVCPTAGDVCRAADGLCVPNNCVFLPELCADGQLCVVAVCVADPCAGVSCPAEEFCRDGACRASCAGVECDAPAMCHDGVCEPSACASDCALGLVCDAATGECVADPCVDRSCGPGEVCDSQRDGCVPDPCVGVRCPGDQFCRRGDCFDRSMPPMPPDAAVDYVYVTGSGGGCAAGGGRASLGGALLIALCLLALRRRTGRGLLPLAVLALLALVACDVDPYALTGPTDAGRDGAATDDGGAGDASGPDAPPGGCTAEVCNGVDDDCDSFVDEGFDLGNDELNCGGCDVSCAKDGARTNCEVGVCVATECFPGFVDLNGDLAAAFDLSNGCEYGCFVSNDGVEACDELDNDCDGELDEEFDFTADTEHCGACGRVCGYFGVAVASCVAGVCGFDPLTACRPGFVDANGAPDDGCEYVCTPTAGGVELCDFLDNDCDGAVDETFDTSTDPAACGLCGRVCSFPNAVASCRMGSCEFDPVSDCLPGFYDADGVQLTGCEYACAESGGGVELCNGLDDDCNGVVDGATVDGGARCHLAPGPLPEGACTERGTIVCVGGALVCSGAPGPASEACNGLDDDCDGVVDDAPVDEGGVCARPVGACSAGLRVCRLGVIDCVQDVPPQPEVCNGIDDDCDGATDEAPTDPGLGASCGSDTGACSVGVRACAGGALVCAGEVAPHSETCNSIDDDCDGVTDNSPVDAFAPCGDDTGACALGTVVCTAGALLCTGAVGPGVESCNDLDDDCDGVTDDGVTVGCYSGLGGTLGVGTCSGGTANCTAGSFGACLGEVVPRSELCDGSDEDCDGVVDDGLGQVCYTGPLVTAGVGRCRDGVQACRDATFSGPCLGEVTPSFETCDSADEDCDGAVDEAPGGGPLSLSCYSGPGGTVGVGRCRAGTQTCTFGGFGACAGEVLPAASDRCGDGIDADCDALTDVAEGCAVSSGGELRLDEVTATEGSAAGAFHSFDVRVASSGANVYAVWVDRENGVADIFLRRSTDGGATFGNIVNLTAAIARPCVAPEIAAAGDRVVVAYQDVGVAAGGVRGLNVVRSVDAGVTFTSPTSGLRLDTGARDNFHHAVGLDATGTRVMVAWEQLDTATLTRAIRSRASADAGVNFAAERMVNVGSGPAPVAGRPVVQVTASGRFVVVWRERRATATFSVYANYAVDTTTAFAVANEDRLDTDATDTENSDYLRLVAAGDNLYVVWQDISALDSGGSDITVSRSTNGATSWSAERILDDPSGEVSASFAPSLAVDPQTASAADDRVWVAWEDRREGTQVYVVRSTDSGAAWDAPTRASHQAGLGVSGVTAAPVVVFGGGNAVLVAYENSAGGRAHVYIASSIDAGTTWQYSDPRLDTGIGAATQPGIARASGGGLVTGAVVVWSDFRTGTGINGDPYRVRFGR